LLADQLAVVHHKDASIHGALIRVEAGGNDSGASQDKGPRQFKSMHRFRCKSPFSQ
jgi:hypothetical protein